ncbi:helicase-related protein [Peredibacter starrii]|uniref:RNA helicase n=1 Tax=Peredibacter starrii TaxID=28202 RepID=A0AAX4HS30_9BACT|nr:helicase-related protein [Peredibacter starrii]WPU65963.1 helicase-related protein [Peredibacter starrii]
MRPLEDSEIVLNTLESIAVDTRAMLDAHPSLESLFEKAFGRIREVFDREAIVETALVEDFIFPVTSTYPVVVDGQFSREMTESYKETYKAWSEEKIAKHLETQNLVKLNFDIKLNDRDLSCQCVQCLGDYRTQVREAVFATQTGMIDKIEEKLHDWVLVKRISDISNAVFDLKKNLDKNFHQLRNKLKRSSVNKLENEVKHHFRTKFGSKSELGKVYKEKLTVFFNTLLVEQGLKPELVSAEEYDRFYLQLETNIWKGEVFLRKEFERFTQAILALKRKDVSSSILRDYLGQFWLHADARRMNRRVIYHMGPTNSGKTYHAIEALVQAKKGCYLAPLRLLASELYDTMNLKGAKTTLLTGEEVIEVPDATHFSSTIEMAKLQQKFDCCVIDEIQMLTDPQRGWAWTRALVNIQADEIHLCGDHSVLELVKKILALCGDTLEIREYTRMTELNVLNHQIPLSQMQKNDALIVFSRRNALKYKADLEELDFKVSIVYGRLSPEVRREQARKFDEGETDIMVSTDAIAMGMNLPVKRIVFSALSKFVDDKENPLTYSEIKQIAGRAGRFKRFPVGEVTTLNRVEDGLHILRNALSHHLGQSDKAMVGPDLDIFSSVNHALESNSLPILSLSEFLRLFNTMTFQKPFYCVDMKEMIELAEMVEAADENRTLTYAEIFGFACAPVNLGLMEHVQYYMWILNHYVSNQSIYNEPIDEKSDNIDYLETSIKCVELFQWLSRHFNQKNFEYDERQLLENKTKAIERLNELLSDKISKTCSSCGCKMPANARFNICDECFSKRRFGRRPSREEGRHEGGRQDGGRGERPHRGKSGGRPGGERSGISAGSDRGGPRRSSRPGSGGPKRSGGGKSDAAKAFRKHR